MHSLLGQHARLEELYVSIGVSWDDSILRRGRFVVLRLPVAEDLKGLVLDNRPCQLKINICFKIRRTIWLSGIPCPTLDAP